MMNKFLVLGIACAAALLAPLASAQAQGGGGAMPVGATTNRFSFDRIALQGDFSYFLIDEDRFLGEATGLRLDLYGQYLAEASSGLFGGYLALPVSSVSRDTGLDDDEGESAVGALELGGLFSPNTSIPLILRVGLFLNLQDADLEGFEELLTTHFVTGPRRLTDFVSIVPETMWLRLGGSASYFRDQLFIRGDFGVDVPVSEPDFFDDNDPAMHLLITAGINTEKFLAAAELTTFGSTDDEEDFLHTLAFTGVYFAGSLHPYVSLILPLDEQMRNDISLILTAGLRYVQ